MSEEVTKQNDYTITAKVTLESNSVWNRSLIKIFNFKSAQVTTVFAEWLVSNGATNTSQMKIENFYDIQSPDEIKLMHQKLIEYGGNPPELSTIIPAMNKKSLPLEQRK